MGQITVAAFAAKSIDLYSIFLNETWWRCDTSDDVDHIKNYQ